MDAAGFFSLGYKSLETEEAPFYHSLNGSLSFAEGAVTIGNARFTLGNTTPTVATTSADTETTGELDLSQPYRISFCVKAAQGAGNFQILINNNTTGSANSIHGGSSRIYNAAANSMSVGQRVVINASLGSATSFVAVRAESTAQVTIDDLWIGYQADTSTEPAAETCVAPAPSAPAAPQVTAGDTELSVSWSAVSGATSYELVYNTVDSSEGATAYANNPIVGTSASITGLTNDTTYYVFVRAVNSGGSSAYSPSSSVMPVAAGGEEEPEEPVNVWSGAAYELFGTSTSIPQGSISLNTASAVTIAAKGGSVNTSNRKFYFAHQSVTGDFVFTARLASVTVANGGAFTVANNNQFRYGILAAENVDVVASYPALGRFAEMGFYTLSTTPTYQASRAYKLDVGASTTQSRSNGSWSVGQYMRIARTGNSMSLYTSADGASYSLVNTSSLANANGNPIADTWQLGFFSASGADELELVFDNVSITQN